MISKAFSKLPRAGILWDFFTFLSNEEAADEREEVSSAYLGDRYRPLLADATLITSLEGGRLNRTNKYRKSALI